MPALGDNGLYTSTPPVPASEERFSEIAESSNGKLHMSTGSDMLSNGAIDLEGPEAQVTSDLQANNTASTISSNQSSNEVSRDSLDAQANRQWGIDPRTNTAFDDASSQSQLQLHGSADLLAHMRDLEQRLERAERELHLTQQRNLREPLRGSQTANTTPEHRDGDSITPHTTMRDSQWNNEIKRWKRVTNRKGLTEIYKASEKIEDVRARSRGFVLTVYDEYDHEGNRKHVSLEINSAPLLDLLRKVIVYYPGDEFDTLRGLEATGDTVTFTDPSMMLFTYRKQLQLSLQRDHPALAKEHLTMLLDFMRTEHPKFSLKLEEIEEGRCKKIGFNYLWLLYPPNTPVYVGKGGVDRQIVVYSRASSINQKGLSVPLKLQCWDVNYEQRIFKRIFSTWIIEPFLGEKDLEDLDLVPAHYMSEAGNLKSKLISRGQRYHELNKSVCLQEYYGYEFPRGFKDEPVRVVVDEETYWRKHPARYSKEDLPSQEFGFPEGEEALVDENGRPFDDTFARCFPRVGVYSIRDKAWSLVNVDDLKPVEYRERAFKRLVIKDDHKKMIKAMVQAYMLEQPGFSDIISGKGRGLTVLIHGPPGTGKTLTAECVAEHQKRPLYAISCGDLGTNPEILEVKLKEVFNYAVAWKAILLLDEADIFLQERSIDDVNRNALVSIFLRELEYYDGILFMTTNRPGDLDEAFVSRIHITVGLKQLDSTERKKIWTIFIRDLGGESDPYTNKEKETLLNYAMQNFEGDRLNGRQIRNTIRIALTLAQLSNTHVTAEHLDQVVRNGREYSNYMTELNKMGAEEYAIALGRRAASVPSRRLEL